MLCKAATCSGGMFKVKALMAIRRLWLRWEGAALAATSSSARKQFSRLGASRLGTNQGSIFFLKSRVNFSKAPSEETFEPLAQFIQRTTIFLDCQFKGPVAQAFQLRQTHGKACGYILQEALLAIAIILERRRTIVSPKFLQCIEIEGKKPLVRQKKMSKF